MMSLMKTSFVLWLEGELHQRGWSQADLAKRARISRAVVSKILGGHTRPTVETLLAIARALEYPPEVVFRKAGILPPSMSVDQEEAEILLHLFSRLSPEERREILDYLRFKLAQKRRSREHTPAPGD